MPNSYDYIPERDQYVDEDDLVAQRPGEELAEPLRKAMEYATKQLQRLAGAFMASGMTLDYHEQHNAEGGNRDGRV